MLTNDEQVYIAGWSRFGALHYVTKLKRGWSVRLDSGRDHPSLFKTRKEACAAVNALIKSIALRRQD